MSPRLFGYASPDAYLLQLTPRASNFNELDTISVTTSTTSVWVKSPISRKVFNKPASPLLSGITEKEINFRECTVTSGVEPPDKKQEATRATPQEMPNALVTMKLILTVVGRKLCHNPNVYSSILRLLWSLNSFKRNVGMPSLVKHSIKIISDARAFVFAILNKFGGAAATRDSRITP
ncbi:Lactamase_B domain-containing protein [Psidium guajava]|nr:Lactamase_B domain-containing protein [Psidium guajava]